MTEDRGEGFVDPLEAAQTGEDRVDILGERNVGLLREPFRGDVKVDQHIIECPPRFQVGGIIWRRRNNPRTLGRYVHPGDANCRVNGAIRIVMPIRRVSERVLIGIDKGRSAAWRTRDAVATEENEASCSAGASRRDTLALP